MFRLYTNLHLPPDVIHDRISNFKAAVQESVHSGGLRNYKFDVDFISDVFKHLFSEDRVCEAVCM